MMYICRYIQSKLKNRKTVAKKNFINCKRLFAIFLRLHHPPSLSYFLTPNNIPPSSLFVNVFYEWLFTCDYPGFLHMSAFSSRKFW